MANYTKTLTDAGNLVERQVIVADHVFHYAADLVRATRPKEPGTPSFLPELVTWGAGPRASQYLILAGKARALLNGRLHVTTKDIQAVAHPESHARRRNQRRCSSK